MPTGGGDSLARGAHRAQFGSESKISDEKWTEMFGEDSLRRLKQMSEEDREKLQEEAIAKVEEIEKSQKPEPIKFRAIQDRIIVSRIEEEEMVNGIFVPDETKEKPAEGRVVAVGPGGYVDGELQKPTISIGERVVFGKYSGAEVKIGFEKYLVLREEDIYLVKE